MLRRRYDTDYKMEKDVVKNFLGAPFQITGARDEGDTAVNCGEIVVCSNPI